MKRERVECPLCHKLVALNKDGTLRHHGWHHSDYDLVGGCDAGSYRLDEVLKIKAEREKPKVPKFKKKPVEIEARRFNEDGPGDAYQLIEWIGDSASIAPGKGITIMTLEGAMLAEVGDWIIKGVEGEFYPVKDSIFKATYEQVDW